MFAEAERRHYSASPPPCRKPQAMCATPCCVPKRICGRWRFELRASAGSGRGSGGGRGGGGEGEGREEVPLSLLGTHGRDFCRLRSLNILHSTPFTGAPQSGGGDGQVEGPGTSWPRSRTSVPHASCSARLFRCSPKSTRRGMEGERGRACCGRWCRRHATARARR